MTNPKEVYTHSRMAAYRACPRKEYYAYELGVREVKTAPALAFGTAFHEGLRAYWERRKAEGPGADPDQRLDVALAAARRKPLPDAFERAKLDAMLLAYVAVWDGTEIIVEHVELPFRVPLRHPDTHEEHPRAVLGGQMDIVFREVATGHLMVGEHKSTSRDTSPGSEYVYRLMMDGQIGLYFHASDALGLDPHEVLYDMATKPLQKPLKGGRGKPPETPEAYGLRVQEAIAEDPEKYIKRVRVPRPEREQAEVWRDAWSWVGKIEQSAADGDWPRNPDSCFRYGSACAYFPVCSGRAEITDKVLYIASGKHVELRGDGDRTMTVDDSFDF